MKPRGAAGERPRERVVRAMERELALYRELREVTRSSPGQGIHLGRAEPGLADALALALCTRRATAAGLSGPSREPSPADTIEDGTNDVAATLDEIRRELGAVIATVSAEARTGRRPSTGRRGRPELVEGRRNSAGTPAASAA